MAQAQVSHNKNEQLSGEKNNKNEEEVVRDKI